MNITAARYANPDGTALHLTTSDMGEVCVYQEHTDDWSAVLSILNTEGVSVTPYGGPDPKVVLRRYAAAQRWAKEGAGTPVNGVTVQTDRDSRTQLACKRTLAQASSGYTANWKLGDGSFVIWNATQLIAAANAADNYAQSCFDKEATAVAAINAGTATTTEQVDAFLA